MPRWFLMGSKYIWGKPGGVPGHEFRQIVNYEKYRRTPAIPAQAGIQ